MPSQKKVPMVALVGLPNSGKSTLLNRIVGAKKAITANEPHTTRDLNYGDDYWEGLFVKYIDTGGLVPNPEDKIQKNIQIKSWNAVSGADLLLWVIDRRQDPDTIHDKIMQKMWKAGKPFIVVINKVDNPELEVDFAEYAKLGGVGFANVSATSSYGMGELMDLIVEKLTEMGFQKTDLMEYGVQEELRIKKGKQGTTDVKSFGKNYYITRENSNSGPGLFKSMSEEEIMYGQESHQNKLGIENLIFDLDGVLFKSRVIQFVDYLKNQFGEENISYKKIEKAFLKAKKTGYKPHKDTKFWEEFISREEAGERLTLKYSPQAFLNLWLSFNEKNQEIVEILQNYREAGYKLFYLSNATKEMVATRASDWIFNLFEDGIFSFQVDCEKPDSKIYNILIDEYKLEKTKTIFIDDRIENIETARDLGLWAIHYRRDHTDLAKEIRSIESGNQPRNPEHPKIILLGKPNVGKSSIFNKLNGEDLQIVTDIPGTTLSVNDALLERTWRDRDFSLRTKKYILLDSTGIRKKGQRELGVETFATYRTIEATNQADVVCLVFDASQPITHQDQVVAGIAKESNRAVVILANKSDLLDEEMKQKFMKDFKFKFQFLKVHKFLWVSTKTGQNISEIWKAVDSVYDRRNQNISPEEIRRLFNYLMKKKPPKKLSTKKRAVIYDLLYTNSNPPTFTLLIKDKTSVHWSYVRFLENIIRKQFNLYGAGIKVKLQEVRRSKILG